MQKFLLQCIIAIVAGLLLTAAHAPFNQWYLAFIAVVLFIYCLRQSKNYWVAAINGYLFFFSHFITAISWISLAVLQVGITNGLLIAMAKFGIALILALFGLILAVAIKYALKFQKPLFIIPVLWVLVEYTRSYWPFNFPWIPLGNSLIANLPLAQTAAVIGVYGLGFTIVFLASAIALKQHRAIIIAVLYFVLSYGIGHYSLWQHPTTFTEAKIRLVQPNIPQGLKDDPDFAQQNLEKLLISTQNDNSFLPDIVIWPEASIRGDIRNDIRLSQYIQSFLPEGSTLLLGAARYAENKVYNSIFVLDQNTNQNMPYYDKRFLVPFGEYIPLRTNPVVIYFSKLMGLYHGLVGNNYDFTPGHTIKTLAIGDIPSLSPLICYESVFSGQVANKGQQRPGWLVSLTNDAWYGDSLGPYQHAALTRMRSIEERLPMIRVANTGISYVTDSYGRIIEQLNLSELGVIDSLLPTAGQPQLFARYGSRILWIMLVLSAFSFVYCNRKVA